MIQSLLDSLREKRMRVVRPDYERFPPPWESKTLGVSMLVKRSAESIATAIIDRDERAIDPYLGWRGNTLADSALRPVTAHRECTIECRDLLDDPAWTLSGHPDGLSHAEHPVSREPLVVVDEAKSHGTPSESDIDYAHRQGANYLAMLAWCHEHGTDAFKPSDHADADARAFYLDPLWTGDGIVVTDMLALFDPSIDPIPVSAQQARRELERITRKANAILAAVHDSDPAIAVRHWDDTPDGRVEFQRPTQSLYDGPIRDEAHIRSLAHFLDSHRSSTSAAKAASEELHAAILAHDADCLELPCGTKVWRTRHAKPQLKVSIPIDEQVNP